MIHIILNEEGKKLYINYSSRRKDLNKISVKRLHDVIFTKIRRPNSCYGV
jgi:hypothetical protein